MRRRDTFPLLSSASLTIVSALLVVGLGCTGDFQWARASDSEIEVASGRSFDVADSWTIDHTVGKRGVTRVEHPLEIDRPGTLTITLRWERRRADLTVSLESEGVTVEPTDATRSTRSQQVTYTVAKTGQYVMVVESLAQHSPYRLNVDFVADEESAPPPEETTEPVSGPDPDSPDAEPPTTDPDEPDTTDADDYRLSLLDRREGFGREAGTGSQGWAETVVTNLEDSGAGSLRDAISAGQRWVRFTSGLSGRVNLSTTLAVPSDIVIDGRGADITLSADSSTRILTMEDVENIIVTNLKLEGGEDGVFIRNGSKHIWIDHLTSGRAADEVFAITGAGDSPADRPDLITVSWTRVQGAGKVMLLGSTTTNVNNAPDRVTLHHNWWSTSTERHPLVRFARVHAYNNWIDRWGVSGSGQGVRVGADAEFCSEANIYDDAHGRPALVAENLGTYGYARSIDDLVTGNPQFEEREPERVFNPGDHYSYSTAPADQALRDLLGADTGWQADSNPGAETGGEETMPPPEPTPTPDGSREELLNRREGFGQQAGTGSLAWPEITVTSLADSGAGSLRDALGSSQRWIRFEPGMSGTINMGATLSVPDDVVIDGRGADVTLKADSSTRILSLVDVQNVIITNLTLEGGEDGVFVRNGSKDIWIDHITSGRVQDEVFAITGSGGSASDRPDRITISWTRVFGAGKVMLLGSTTTNINNAPDRVTLHHNWWAESTERHPLVRFARVHAYNNWIDRWGSSGSGQGVRVGADAQYYSEANIFDDAHGRPALVAENLGTYGYIRSVGDLVTGSPQFEERQPDEVFDPSTEYTYLVDNADQALRDALIAGAGARP